MKMGKSIAICYDTTQVLLCKQFHGITAGHLESVFDNEFTQMNKYRSFGQLISFGPRSIQLEMGGNSLSKFVIKYKYRGSGSDSMNLII